MCARRHRLRLAACWMGLGCALVAARSHAETTAATAAPPVACSAGAERQRVTLALQPPESQAVLSLVISLTYDPALLRLPALGSGADVRKRLKATGGAAMLTPNNLGGALRIVAARSGELPLGPLVDVEFDRCAGARVPTAADLRCTVESCAGSGGPVAGCTCTASLP